MNEPWSIHLASYVGPEGYGNDRQGLHAWNSALAAAMRRGDLSQLAWADLFSEESPRFARMDLLCRIGILAVEFLDAQLELWPAERRDAMGVVLETAHGCLTTDLQFLRTPRPSLFAYTLPSTLLGEVCIRHRLRGSQLCLMTERGDGAALLTECRHGLAADRAPLYLALACDVPAADLGGDARAWFAAAALIGSAGIRREYPLQSETLLNTCRRICAVT